MSKVNECRQVGISAFPEKASEKTSKLSAEIARLMREGTPEGRKKAQGLLQMALEKRELHVKGDVS
jgi:hypothetical protein